MRTAPKPAVQRLVFLTVADLGELSGPAIHVLQLVRHLARTGLDVTLISPQPGAAMPVGLGGAVRHIELPPRQPGRPAMALFPAMARSLRGLPRPDAVYLRASVGTWPILAYARRLWRVPVVVEYNGWFSADLEALGRARRAAPAARWLQVREAASADAVRVVTNRLRDLLVEHGVNPNKVVVIDNGTDLEMFRPLDRTACRRELGLRLGGTLLAFAGNLWPAIDLATVFAAVAALRADGVSCDLAIVGDGPGRARFEQEAAALSVDVHWLGARQPVDVNRVLNAADVVLAPFTRGRNEKTGLAPLKIRDCAAAGRPCVASRINGIDRLKDQPWMFLAEPEDPSSFADAIRAALATDPEMARTAARSYAEVHFDWSAIAREVAALASTCRSGEDPDRRGRSRS